MFGLCFVFFAVAALLCATTNVAALPTPPMKVPVPGLAPGQIVGVAPAYYSHSRAEMTKKPPGAKTILPHIFLGYEGPSAVVVPVVSGAHPYNPSIGKPKMIVPRNEHGLDGHHAGLDYYTVNSRYMVLSHENSPVYGKVIPPRHLVGLEDARALVAAHHDTSVAHAKAASIHFNFVIAHTQLATQSLEAGDHHAAHYYVNKAKEHMSHAQNHANAADHQLAAMKVVDGPNNSVLHDTHKMKGRVIGIHHTVGYGYVSTRLKRLRG